METSEGLFKTLNLTNLNQKRLWNYTNNYMAFVMMLI